MGTFAADQDTKLHREEVERRVREAWAAYMDSTQDLEGRAYDDAEAKAWDRLRVRLREISY
jgi:hypothetical protein